MSISIWTVYNNLAVRVNPGPTFNRDKARLNPISGKIPRYKGTKFDFWEIPKASFIDIHNQFADEDMQIAENAQDFINKFTINTSKIKDLPREELKPGLNVRWDGKELRDYQIDYITIDSRRTALLNFLDTGMGKGSVSLLLAVQRSEKRILVVSPRPVIGEWLNGIWNEVLGPQTKVLKYRGSPAQRVKLRTQFAANEIVITNYEMVGELVDNDLDKFDSIIVDEAHNIQNRTTTIYKNIRRLIKRHKGSLQLLTATPLENDISQLWTLLNLVNPDLAGDERSFLNKFQEETAWINKTARNGKTFRLAIKFKTKNEEQLKDLLERAGVRLKKESYINYIPKSNVIPVEMTKKQTQDYERVVEQILIDCQTDGFYAQNPLVRLLDLLKAAEGEGKVEYLQYRLPKLDKAIVWSRFRWLPELLHTLYPATSVLYNGDKSDNYRKLIKWSFEGCLDSERDEFYSLRAKHPDFEGFEPASARYFFGTYNSKSGAGLNLPSAQHCFFTSFDYSGRTLKQTRERNQRLYSSFDELYTNYIVSLFTIENEILARILQKIERSANILDGNDSSDSLSAREVISILRKTR